MIFSGRQFSTVAFPSTPPLPRYLVHMSLYCKLPFHFRNGGTELFHNTVGILRDSKHPTELLIDCLLELLLQRS